MRAAITSILNRASILAAPRQQDARDKALLCFVHIPKTAGTAMTDLLHRNYSESLRTFTVAGRKGLDGLAKTVHSPDEDIQSAVAEVQHAGESIRAVAGHIPYGLHAVLGRSVRYFAIVRDPLRRSLSQYFHIMDDRRNTPLRRLMMSYDFDFRRAIEDGAAIPLMNDQTRMLIGSSKLMLDENDLERAKEIVREHYLLVGTQDRMSECIGIVAEQLGWQERDVPVLNARREDIEAPPAELDSLFRDSNRIDQALYDWIAGEYLGSKFT
jgi:hypothetical protein